MNITPQEINTLGLCVSWGLGIVEDELNHPVTKEDENEVESYQELKRQLLQLQNKMELVRD